MSRRLAWTTLLAASVGFGAAISEVSAAPLQPVPLPDQSAVIQVQHHYHQRRHHHHQSRPIVVPRMHHHHRPIAAPRAHHHHRRHHH